MKDGSKSVKPFTYAEPNERRAKVLYVMAIRGVRAKGLHWLLASDPSFPMVCMVINAVKKSAPLEERISAVLGVPRVQLFGTQPLQLWGAA